MSSVKVFTAEEVAAHSSRNDVWTIIDGKVYDITKFLDEHPGGEEVLLEGAGADSTEGFEDVGHSEDARDLLKKYYVGDLKGGVPSKKATEKAAPSSAPKASSDNSTTFFTISIAVVAAVAFAWKHFSA